MSVHLQEQSVPSAERSTNEVKSNHILTDQNNINSDTFDIDTQSTVNVVHEELTTLLRTAIELKKKGQTKKALQLYLDNQVLLNLDLPLSIDAANTFRQAGLHQTSLELINKSIQQHGQRKELMHCWARIKLQLGEFKTALAIFTQLISQGNESFSIWFDLGVVHSRLGNLEQGLDAFNHAQDLDPDHQITTANRITLLKDLCKIKEARDILNQIETKKHDNLEIKGAEAGLLMAEQNMAEAAMLFTELCTKQTHQPLHWLNLAAAERGQRKTIRPDRIIRQALRAFPNHYELKQAFLQSLTEMGQQNAARRLLSQINLEQISHKDQHFFNLEFLAASCNLLPEAKRQELAKAWERRRQSDALQNLWKDHLATAWPGRRLRIGYLSSDFCNHPVSRFLLPVLQTHDHSKVEIWGLHTGPHWDAVSESIRECCDHWLDLSACHDAMSARAIADQQLDVLVELGGYTGHSRIGICLHHPAPIQMSYLGFPGATFLESVPGWIGDEVLFKTLHPLEAEQHQLAYIKGGYMTLPKPNQCPEVNRTATPCFRFGSLNHARKLSDQTISLWSDLLKAAPNAELALKSFSFIEAAEQQRIRQRFEQGGIQPARILLLPWAEDHATHLAQYNEIDVALDPIPYGGATTTAEALWMGVPVICQQGRGMVGSLSASILTSAGMPELIHINTKNYLTCAINYYQQGIRNNLDRQKLIEIISNSHLNQPRRVSSQLESIFENYRSSLKSM